MKKNTPIPITARQLESLIRLSEARARMRLSDKVIVEYVERYYPVIYEINRKMREKILKLEK